MAKCIWWIVVQNESIYCEFSIPYSSLIVISLVLIKVCDLLIFPCVINCISYHVLIIYWIIALIDLYLPLANILFLWHVVSNYFVIWYSAPTVHCSTGSIFHKLSGPAHKAGQLATDWLLKVIKMFCQSEVGCCNLNTPVKLHLAQNADRGAWTTISPRQVTTHYLS